MKINIPITKILFLDIETVPNDKGLFTDLQKAFEKKTKAEPIDYLDGAGLYPEFGQICCISVGYFHEGTFRKKSFCGADEKVLIAEFIQTYRKIEKTIPYICGHNSNEFDLPFIIKRACINGIHDMPDIFETYGKKPWELDKCLDTMILWKGASLRGTASLMALCACFGLPNPKECMDGTSVYELFKAGKYDLISSYCEGDVCATANVFIKMTGNDEKLLIK